MRLRAFLGGLLFVMAVALWHRSPMIAGRAGAADPALAQANIAITVRRPGYSRAVRPSYAITGPLKRRPMDVQHPGARMADYELDHLIPISLGRAPFDTRDLWLQPWHGQANAAQKNALAYILWRLVCEHRMPLRRAQRAISHNWIQALATHATPDNLARYRFRSHDLNDQEAKGVATIPSEEGVSHAT